MSRLQERVKATGKKQAEIAKALGRTEGRVSQYLTGKETIPAEVAVELSKFTDIPLHEIRPDLWPDPTQAAA